MKTVLIVSPYFPPSTVAGVHRARILARHLPRAGWNPVIFCVHERHHEQSLDQELAELVPSSVKVIKVGAIPTKLARNFGVGDLGIRGYFPLRRALEAYLEQERGDVLLISALPGMPLTLGPLLRRKFGIPFVADYQDPWLPQNYDKASSLSKAGILYKITQLLEPYVLRHADHVTAVSSGTNELIRARYPWLSAEIFSGIPIGGSREDFEHLRNHPRSSPILEGLEGKFIISYVGNVWERAHETLDAFFQAIVFIKKSNPELYNRLRLVFVGTSNQPGAREPVVLPFAERAGISEIVREEPSRIAYLDALNLLMRSNLSILLGSDEPHYTASKLYPMLLSGVAGLAVFHEKSSACEVIREVGGARLLTFNAHRPVADIAGAISQELQALCLGQLCVPPIDQSKLEPYLGPEVASKFANVFEQALQRIKI